MFNLKFISAPYWSDDRNQHVLRGCITLGDFAEEFESSLSYWRQADYEQQWREAAKRIESREARSAFIVDMYNPSQTPFIMWWPIWRNDKIIFVQNQLLLFDQLVVAFNEANPYIHIGERTTENEEGQRISQWQVSLSDIEDFITSFAITAV
jgi:hypothetical protein